MATDLIQIDQELVRLSQALGTAIDEYEAVCKQAAEARSAYDIERARALLKANGSSRELREAEATVLTKDQMTECRIKENLMGALKERIRALQSVISVQQTRLRYLDEGDTLGHKR
jgi:hypothetical protein